MTKSILALLLVANGLPLQVAAQDDAPWEPTRINRAIELLERGQPLYYQHVAGGGYDEGLSLAGTEADYITYDLEHGPFDVTELREFMRGLVDGGPTASGHRTPAVIVTLPILGRDEAGMRANYWVVQQILAAGVHGVLLCHAEDPGAVRLMIEASRYPFAPEAGGLDRGLRGAGSQGFAAEIWGVSQSEYLRMADPWPLNPEGELFIGVKIENRYALENAELTTRVPGLGYAEWGPSDMGFSLVGAPTPGMNSQDLPEMRAARDRVFEATRAAGVFFLDTCNNGDVAEKIDEGVMICTGGAAAGREHTSREMPW